MRKTRGFWPTAVLLGAVLVALGVAGSGNQATAAKPTPPRFVDNGDGTVTDNQTGLMWEKKTSGVGGPSEVNNAYSWSSSGSAPDGTLFTDFLAQMNCASSADGTCPLNGKYRDWRIPTVTELRSILDTSVPGCGVSPFPPCIDPIFGPTASGYWSSTSEAGNPESAWAVRFFDGLVGAFFKVGGTPARAVRGGS